MIIKFKNNPLLQIRAEGYFFYLIKKDKETIVKPTALTLNDNIITVSTELGEFKVKCILDDEYFSFELLSSLPEASYKLVMAHCKYNYDYTNKQNSGAVGIALTYWANPCFFPDSKSLETKAEVTAYLKDIGAKYALIIAPVKCHKEIIKKVCLTIDKRYGIVTKHGGAWGQDSPLNYGNTIIPDHNSEEFVNERMELFKTLGLSHIDFHKGNDSFHQGDFKYVHFKDGEDFKNRVVKRLEENNMYAGLHTYTAYIDYECDSILSNPKWQKQLNLLGEYTLSDDIDENALFLPTVESTDSISTNFGFHSKNTPYILVGSEIMEFENVSVKIHRSWHTAFIAFGSNMGDRLSYINDAIANLKADMRCEVKKVSKSVDSSTLMKTYASSLPPLTVTVGSFSKTTPGIILYSSPVVSVNSISTKAVENVFFTDSVLSCNQAKVPPTAHTTTKIKATANVITFLLLFFIHNTSFFNLYISTSIYA